MVAYYPFNGNSNDKSGNATRIELDATIYYVGGIIGQGLASAETNNDAGSQIVVSNPFIEDYFTLSFWVKSVIDHNKTYGDSGLAVWHGTDVAKRSFGVTLSSGNHSAYHQHEYPELIVINSENNAGSGSSLYYGENQLSEYEWHHVSLTYENGNINIFANGQPIIQDKVTNNSPVGLDLKLTLRGDDLLDELRIYNRVLSEEEIQSLFQVSTGLCWACLPSRGGWRAILHAPNNEDSTVLTSGDVVSGAVSKGEWINYKINTNSLDARISFDLTHLSDDVDMYVKRGARPTLDDYDCRPFEPGTWSESCSKENSGDYTWYVGVYGAKGGDFRVKTLIGKIDGWSSDTGFREADTDIREHIVEAATNAISGSSGQSIATGSLGWLTDIANGDGERMRNAIRIYHNWRSGASYTGYTDSEIRNQMITAFNDSEYQDAHQGMLADRIISVYDGSVPQSVPENDEETLQYLGIRKQCLEWAMTIAHDAGGAAINFANAGASVSEAKVRPGMGYYNRGIHAMIIIDVYHDSTGTPTELRVAESNYALKWSNPDGQVPWERTIAGDRKETFGYTIINYDLNP